jgi:hypothetical protein
MSASLLSKRPRKGRRAPEQSMGTQCSLLFQHNVRQRSEFSSWPMVQAYWVWHGLLSSVSQAALELHRAFAQNGGEKLVLVSILI